MQAFRLKRRVTVLAGMLPVCIWVACALPAISPAQNIPLPAVDTCPENVKPVQEIPPQPHGLDIYVNDYGCLLTPQDKSTLQERLQTLDTSGIAQISILILPDTDQELSDFAFRIMNQWGIQHHKKKDGLLVLVNANRVRHNLPNRIFVATGLALEPLLPDALVGRILDEKAIPAFEQGDYSGGITRTVFTLSDIIAGDRKLRSQYTHPHRQNEDINWPVVVFIFIFILLFFRRNRGGFGGGGGFYGGGGYFGDGGFSGGGGGGFDGGFGGGGDSSGGGGAGR